MSTIFAPMVWDLKTNQFEFHRSQGDTTCSFYCSQGLQKFHCKPVLLGGSQWPNTWELTNHWPLCCLLLWWTMFIQHFPKFHVTKAVFLLSHVSARYWTHNKNTVKNCLLLKSWNIGVKDIGLQKKATITKMWFKHASHQLAYLAQDRSCLDRWSCQSFSW